MSGEECKRFAAHLKLPVYIKELYCDQLLISF